jgi:FxsC-like protein
MNDYWFFFSYAHADQNAYLDQFYQDLASEVRGLTGSPAPESGFLDRKDIEHGAAWDATLEQGLQHARVFVPIYSASYFRAPYCGKEFAIFRDRVNAAGLKDAPLILPVLWFPENDVLAEIPSSVSKIQYKHGDYPAQYLSEGVAQLNRLGVASNSPFYVEYWKFVRQLAQTIVARAKSHQLPVLNAPLTALDQVSSIFSAATKTGSPDEGGPRYVQFIFVAGNRSELKAAQRSTLKFYGSSGSDWQPYLDKYQGTAEALAIEAMGAVGPNSHYEEVPLSAALNQQVEQAASQDKIVVVMVDTWTLRIQKYYDLIAPLDHQAALNCIVVVVWNEDDHETSITNKAVLEGLVNVSFDTKIKLAHPNFFANTVKSYDSFKSELARALVQAQSQIIDSAKKKKDLMFTLIRPATDNSGTKPFF